MARTDPARLSDLQDGLDMFRSWDGIEDRGGGTFYLRRKPFLHFHAGRDHRRADVRGPEGWTEVDLPEPSSAAARRRLVKALLAARGPA